VTNNTIEISFGKGMLPVRIPADANATIIRKNHVPKLADQHAAIRHALDQPIAAKPFRQLAQGRKSACILICDITRPVPNHLFLRPMIEDLLAAGMAKENWPSWSAIRGSWRTSGLKIISPATTPTTSTSAARQRAGCR
jgi:nickel-dependent lactate racemase